MDKLSTVRIIHSFEGRTLVEVADFIQSDLRGNMETKIWVS